MNKGRGLAITAFVFACVTALAAIAVFMLFGGYALFVLMFGAPGHVLSSVAHYGAIAAAIALPPLAVPTIVLAVIALLRASGAEAPAPGVPRRRTAKGLAITALILAGSCLLSILLGAPFWGVEPCMTSTC